MAFDPNKRRMPEPSPMANVNPYFNAPVQPKKNGGNGLKIIVGIFIAIVLVIVGAFVALSMATNTSSPQNGGVTEQSTQNNAQNLTEVEIFNVQ